MKLEGKQLAKLALIFFGLLFIVCLFLGRRQKQEETPAPPEGERITAEDVEILLDALGVSFSMAASGSDRTTQSAQETDGEEDAAYFTYGQYGELCRQIGEEEWGLPDYSGQYEPEQALLKEDWYDAFRILLAYLDTESAIWETTVFVLKVDEEKQEAYTENGAMQGASRYCSTAFAENELQEMRVYVKGDTLLTIVEVMPEDHYLGSVWVMENKDGTLDCFYRQTAFRAALSGNAHKNPPKREQIADLTFRGGRVVEAKERREKIHGKLLRATAQELEIEDYGIYQIAEEMEIYKLYGSLKTLEQAQLRVGCADTDFVVDKGKVYACLVSEEAGADQIRVLLKNTATGTNYHERVGITVDGAETGIRADQMTVGERRIYRSENLTDKVTVEMEGSTRADSDYRGSIECLRMEEGIGALSSACGQSRGLFWSTSCRWRNISTRWCRARCRLHIRRRRLRRRRCAPEPMRTATFCGRASQSLAPMWTIPRLIRCIIILRNMRTLPQRSKRRTEYFSPMMVRRREIIIIRPPAGQEQMW